MFKEQYIRDNDKLKAKETLLMEIKEKNTREKIARTPRQKFVRYGAVFAAFVLAKYVRDNAATPSDTPMWSLVVWGGFALSMALTAWGLWRMEVNPTWKAYLMVSWLYLISSAFTLAKTLRDAYEADRLERSQEGVAQIATDFVSH